MKRRLCKFLKQTHKILEAEEYNNIISWNEEGNKILLKNIEELEKCVLSKYFKHCNYSSFLRQLNLYNFKSYKLEDDTLQFSHPSFQKQTKEFSQILRRKPESQRGNYLLDQTNELKQQLKQLKAQQIKQMEHVQLAQIRLNKSIKLISDQFQVVIESKQLYQSQISSLKQKGIQILKFTLRLTDQVSDPNLRSQIFGMWSYYVNYSEEPSDLPIPESDLIQLTPLPFNSQQ